MSASVKSIEFLHLGLRYTDRHGEKRVAGKSGLKATELYTPEFGRALAVWWSGNAPIKSGTAKLLFFHF